MESSKSQDKNICFAYLIAKENTFLVIPLPSVHITGFPQITNQKLQISQNDQILFHMISESVIRDK
jgi:hypothetical protein